MKMSRTNLPTICRLGGWLPRSHHVEIAEIVNTVCRLR